ncbi:unnamed protein product [Albugo candida]|uniref:Uncharacterized protein n=1 Tax=Albugo candida TaxID=65357 RepID=A0A024G2C9_9STRA|nr:unnamed protein product [Albugo candida]|eukprot:CCI41008.1 unnamed protein product [Albugo candida]
MEYLLSRSINVETFGAQISNRSQASMPHTNLHRFTKSQISLSQKRVLIDDDILSNVPMQNDEGLMLLFLIRSAETVHDDMDSISPLQAAITVKLSIVLTKTWIEEMRFLLIYAIQYI